MELSEIITGERIQVRCDVQIGYKNSFNHNTNIRIYGKNPLYLENVEEDITIKNKRVFIYSVNAYTLTDKLHFENCIIYYHNSDRNFDKLLENIDESNKIYCQNNAMEQYNVLPIGIANSMWKHGNISLLYNTMQLNIPKKNHIFFNFSPNTNKVKREICKRVCQSKGIRWINTARNQADYLKSLASHKYAICPEGNGYDSHRIWECLYLGVIPITVKNDFTIQLKKLLEPNNKIIIYDNWQDMNVNDLLKNYENFETDFTKLKLSFFIDP